MNEPPVLHQQLDRSEANVSDCGRYRYSLIRQWCACCYGITWIGLNPSTADSVINDPTVRRIRGFSELWGYGGFNLVNLFAYRATSPCDLREAGDPIGPLNDEIVLAGTQAADVVVVAWGQEPFARARAEQLMRHLPRNKLWSLGTNADGSPRHPLYVPYTAGLVPFGRELSR